MTRNARSSTILSFFTIVGWTATVLGLFARGYLSTQVSVYALLAMVLCVALASALKLSVAKTVMGVGLPCVSLALFIVREGAGNQHNMKVLAVVTGALIIALFGVYIMVRGFFR